MTQKTIDDIVFRFYDKHSHCKTMREAEIACEWLRQTVEHVIETVQEEEKTKYFKAVHKLPAFSPTYEKTMSKVADDAKVPAFGMTNYLERETVLNLINDL